MTASPSVDSCRRRLHRAGWSIGDACCSPQVWQVYGTHGEHRLHAEGRTQAEAWRCACEIAESAGLLVPINEGIL
jgi:hypothetical protein